MLHETASSQRAHFDPGNFFILTVATVARVQIDPLPSWNEGASKIFAFDE